MCKVKVYYKKAKKKRLVFLFEKLGKAKKWG